MTIITVFPPNLDQQECFTVKSTAYGENRYSDELSIHDIDTLAIVLRKIEDNPKILATWDLYLEMNQPFTFASNTEKWQEIREWISKNHRPRYW